MLTYVVLGLILKLSVFTKNTQQIKSTIKNWQNSNDKRKFKFACEELYITIKT